MPFTLKNLLAMIATSFFIVLVTTTSMSPVFWPKLILNVANTQAYSTISLSMIERGPQTQAQVTWCGSGPLNCSMTALVSGGSAESERSECVEPGSMSVLILNGLPSSSCQVALSFMSDSGSLSLLITTRFTSVLVVWADLALMWSFCVRLCWFDLRRQFAAYWLSPAQL